MLAYVFWHRPQEPGAVADYERAQLAFHGSLAHARPAGLIASAVFRAGELLWLPAAESPVAQDASAGYEDWYLLEDFAALGVLNEAAVGHAHGASHDDVARRAGAGAGGLYGLIEGEPGAEVLDAAAVAVWVARPPGAPRGMLAELLGDGVERGHASLWRRHLVLGPAPEFCLLADAGSPAQGASGVAASRLPEGWSATRIEREVLWHG